MTRYSFTGPTRLTQTQVEFVAARVRALPPPDEVTTGGAPGVDMLVANVALSAWPSAVHRVIVPAPPAPHAEAAVTALVARGAYVIVAPAGREPYRLRNEELVAHGDLVAFVRRATFYRSGEWMTVNIARALGVPVQLEVLP